MTLSRDAVDELLEQLPLPACVVRDLRVVAANERLARLTGRSREALMSSKDAFADLLSLEDVQRLMERSRARLRGEPVPDAYEFTGRRPDGTPIPASARVSPFPLGGPGALLFTCTDESARASMGARIRGFVDLAVALQAERTEKGIFHVVAERLKALGLPVTLSQIRGDTFRLVEGPSTAHNPFIDQVRRRWPGWIPRSAFPYLEARQGTFIDDLPAVLAQIFHRPREEFAGRVPPHLVVASVPVSGIEEFILSISAADLDSNIASALGLLGKQIGGALETVRRVDELARSNRELSTFNAVALASQAPGASEALQGAVDALAASLGFERVALFRREGNDLLLAVQHGFAAEWEQEAARLSASDGTLWARALRARETIIAELDAGGQVRNARPRLETPPGGTPPLGIALAGASLPPPINAAALPLIANDEALGVVAVMRDEGELSREELNLLTAVAAQLAVRLQNVLLFQQTHARVEELSHLLELGQAISSTLDLTQVLQAATRITARMLRCPAAFVLLPDEEETELRTAAGWVEEGVHFDYGKGAALPLSSPSLSALAYRERRPQSSGNLADDARVDRPERARWSLRSSLAVPLLAHDRCRGVLSVVERGNRPRSDVVLGEQDARLAMHAAQLITAALENAELFERERRRADEASLLQQMASALQGSLELGPLLTLAGESLRKLVGTTGWYVLLLDPQRSVLRTVAAPPERLRLLEGIELRMDQPSLAVTAVRERRVVQVEDAARSKLVAPQMLRVLGGRTILAVPLIARDQVLGAVVLDDNSSRVFSEAEVERVTTVSRQVALAVLSARLFEDLRGSYAELARAQAELIDRERLAALGELSASIAHEVRNPLGVVFNSVGSLRRILKPAPGTDVELLLGIVGEEADRLNRMVGDLLDYSRPVQPALQPVALRPLIEDAAASARGAGESPVELRITVAEGASTVRADARLLRQALVNLFLNSYQAMTRGGRLTIAAGRAQLEGKEWARLVIRDTGPGIPGEARGKIFQPFFTTKATGTGLGLAVVKRIVEGHGGRISLAEHGGGAEFQLFLPLDGV